MKTDSLHAADFEFLAMGLNFQHLKINKKMNSFPSDKQKKKIFSILLDSYDDGTTNNFYSVQNKVGANANKQAHTHKHISLCQLHTFYVFKHIFFEQKQFHLQFSCSSSTESIQYFYLMRK